MKTGYIVLDIMTTRPIKVKPDMSVRAAAGLMRDKDVGSLLVMTGDQLEGIVTEKDIVAKITATGDDPNHVRMRDIMTKKENLITISPGKDIYDAIVMMQENNTRRLPVVDDGKLIGLITVKDILRIEPALFDIIAGNIEIREADRKFKDL